MKAEYPILEFDDSKAAIIEPSWAEEEERSGKFLSASLAASGTRSIVEDPTSGHREAPKVRLSGRAETQIRPIWVPADTADFSPPL